MIHTFDAFYDVFEQIRGNMESIYHLSNKEANCCLWWRHLGASVFSSRFQWNPSKNQSKRRYDSADFIIRDTMVSGPTVCGNEQLQ